MNFLYQAKTNAGVIEGKIDAPSEDQAVMLLQQKGLFVLSLTPEELGVFSSDLFAYFRRPSRKDLVIFTRQLATLIDADVPLVEALSILSRQAEKESFRHMIVAVQPSTEGGPSLSVAFGEHDYVFNRFYTSLVRVGEVSGKLQDTLLYLADYLERSAELSSKVRGALFYPVFVLISMVVVTIVMMTTVIPQLLAIIQESGVTDLPLPTRILVALSGFFNHYGILLLLVAAIAVIVVYYYFRTSKGRLVWDRFTISLPKFGRIVRDVFIARIAETLVTLVRASVPILESLEITADVVGNEIYRAILMDAHKNVQSGGTLSEILMRHKEIPTLVSSMLQTGERTGRTEAMLGNVLKFYHTEADNDIRNISQLIEPVLILILGVGIGLLVAAILLPIYSLVNVV